ncbi:hypothetical protein C0992_009677 [Termitomyces sp. T32_za158]|nr:hypothetical protein C0992_009677 [Termitomyces sp. T32_za158]
MHTTTLFTFLAALFLAFLSCASALPTTFERRDSTPGPRSLLGRTYLRHATVNPPPALPRAITPTETAFVGRSERFQAIQRQRVARGEHERREAAAPQLHVYPVEEKPQEVAEIQRLAAASKA